MIFVALRILFDDLVQIDANELVNVLLFPWCFHLLVNIALDFYVHI